MRYPKEVKEAVLQRMMAPGNEAIAVLAREFNVTEATLYAWRREALKSGAVIPGESRSSEQWSGAAKFAVVVETASLSEADLGEYCRKKGLFPEQVSAWREQCEASFDRASGRSAASTEKAERKRIRQLEKELRRKERALAEAAALLVLRKNVHRGAAPSQWKETFGRLH